MTPRFQLRPGLRSRAALAVVAELEAAGESTPQTVSRYHEAQPEVRSISVKRDTPG